MPLRGISVGKPSEDSSPEAERKTFKVLDGFEVGLFASEKEGVTKPISIRWDERGRLWVITAKSYPQPEPGEAADDKVLILEDTDHDGRADKVTVFADGLRMPMGLELAPSATWPQSAATADASSSRKQERGHVPQLRDYSPDAPGTGKAASGLPTDSRSDNPGLKEGGRHPMAAYVGEGEKLWLMRDLDGDGRADAREVVFSGFGTGDTHQCINSFTWTPDGALVFSQGLHCYSNVTTPWGGRRLYGAGFWTYRPLRAQLTPYPTGFPLNAWGTVYDDAGQPFSVAGAAGMFWTTPLLVSTEHLIEGRALPNNGQIVKQGMLKYCGVDIPRNAHWPAEMHGELVSGGFFENCIYRHKLQTDSANPSGYEATRQPDLITSSSVAFRPVDVKFGPDGALYVSDWYNPIIGHYQASFRHPDRDKMHGRIWRVVKKGAPLAKMRELGKMNAGALLDVLEKGDRWEQYQAQRVLLGMEKEDVLKATWKPKDPMAGISSRELEKARISLRAHNCFEVAHDWLVGAVRGAPRHSDPRHDNSDASWQFRCEGVRSVGLWQHHVEKAHSQLELSVTDDNPRVRLEAVAACAHLPEPPSMRIALRALDKPMDSFLDRTLELAVHALAPQWEPALREGKLSLPPRHLAWLLDRKSDGDTLARIRATLRDKPGAFDPDSRRALLLMLARRGTGEDVAAALDSGTKDAELLSQLADLVEAQGIQAPANAETKVGEADGLRGGPPREHSAAVRLIGLWKLSALAPRLTAILEALESPPDLKRAALVALARLNSGQDRILKLSADAQQPYVVRLGAVEALAIGAPAPAAKAALGLMPQAKTEDEMRALLAPFLAKAGRSRLLAAALGETPCGKEAAELASRALIAIGRNEPELSAALNRILGRSGVVMPFDAQWVSSLANEANVAGDARRGDEVFHRVALNCIACHQVKGQGGIIGPALDVVGRGVPVELLVEAVMWPQRQIKEGYIATTVVTKDGRTLVGYKQGESQRELAVRDMATQAVTVLNKEQIQTRTDAGSLMPDGLTASLSREELRDLIAYLASLGRDAK